jgi:two-component system sensor histidine kinase/response regulator
MPRRALDALGSFLVAYGQRQQLTVLTNADDSGESSAWFWCLGGPGCSLVVIADTTEMPPDQMTVGLMTQPAQITPFLDDLLQRPHLSAALREQLRTMGQELQPTTPEVKDAFMLAWVATCLDPNPAVTCQPVQAQLNQQMDRSLLLSQVITKIQESLDLSVILQTTVAEVRQFLQADRLLIYQFDLAQNQPGQPSPVQTPPSPEAETPVSPGGTGYITYEARSSDRLASVLHYTEARCFQQHPDYNSDHRQRYLDGETLAIDDVRDTYRQIPCMLSFLEQAQVQSKAVAPIVVGQHLWGLLIVHQCMEQRCWQSWEIDFLKHIAEHLAIAINQAQLYHQLQQQTQNLEVCVVERTQDLRDALAAAQSANRAKSDFLATMSHELRTPLTYIIGMSATLLRWSIGDLSSRQRDYLTTIHTSGEHLLSLINDILEVSKIESGRTVLEVREFSLTSLSRQSMDAFRPDASRNGIDLSLDIKLTPGQDLFVADPRRVRQILANLLSNAVKFTPAEGKVTLRVRREQNAAVFQVEDTGIGIPEAAQPLLFEKFQQLENVRQREYQGTGLGLALTKQLVELHGGSIKVASEVGVGSVFTIRLPPQRLSAPSATPGGPETLTPEPIVGRIVLVEDNEESASIICDMLTAADYQVIWIIDGARVLDQVELLQPAAVITNVSLASADGYAIINDLRHSVGTFGVKIMALLDVDDGTEAERAMAAGASGIITKPIDPQQLLAKVNAVMATHVLSDTTLRQ